MCYLINLIISYHSLSNMSQEYFTIFRNGHLLWEPALCFYLCSRGDRMLLNIFVLSVTVCDYRCAHGDCACVTIHLCSPILSLCDGVLFFLFVDIDYFVT